MIVSPDSLVRLDVEGRILLDHLDDARSPSSPRPPCRFGAIATEITGSGKTIGSRVAGLFGSHSVWPVVRVLHPEQRDDVAGLGAVDLFARIRVQLHQAPDPLALAGGRVEHRVALVDRVPE